uniref:dTDP-glucose 4,6-dehydratase n=1 Tax=Streptomyces sp. TA-0256 TaxID=573242 RepID=E5RLM6_9ACTN|nr:putative dTDP-glucose 4,6-dehydratase [Streptomyces sp. TA-0256]
MHRAAPSRTVLVTGAAGFIGANFVHYWRAAHPGDTVVALDALTYAGNEENLATVRDGIVFVHADIADGARMSRVLREHRVEVVVNFAAESHNSLAVLDPARFFRTNVLGTQALLEASLRAGVERFHHISTCEVYGDLALDSPDAFREDRAYRPRTPYNASKAGADHAVRAYHETFGLPVTLTNCANNYGPYQFPEKVIPLFVTNALLGRPLPVYASRDHRREWIHVDDHCRAIDAVLTGGEPGRTYHVGSGVEASVQDIADAVLAELGLPASLQTTVADRPGHDRRYLLDSGLIRRTLGWRPTVEFAEGLARTIRWYRSNPTWWEPLLERRPVTEESVWQQPEVSSR